VATTHYKPHKRTEKREIIIESRVCPYPFFFSYAFVCRAQANIPNRQISGGAFFTVRGSFPFRAFVSILAVHLCGLQDEEAAHVTGKALLVTQNGHQSGWVLVSLRDVSGIIWDVTMGLEKLPHYYLTIYLLVFQKVSISMQCFASNKNPIAFVELAILNV